MGISLNNASPNCGYCFFLLFPAYQSKNRSAFPTLYFLLGCCVLSPASDSFSFFWICCSVNLFFLIFISKIISLNFTRNSPLLIWYIFQKQVTSFIYYFKMRSSRVARKNFTSRLSQNRTWQSPVILFFVYIHSDTNRIPSVQKWFEFLIASLAKNLAAFNQFRLNFLNRFLVHLISIPWNITVHFRSSSVASPDNIEYCLPPQRSLPWTFNPSSLWRFESSSCKPNPRGLLLIFQKCILLWHTFTLTFDSMFQKSLSDVVWTDWRE